ncbi:MAG TPA: hybrid sensor histidine kinase/response regulator [Candidatus Kapabacteria bacterium]|nr:hybrid sensor histidine kinase/response regulator [Candidatus Kapabacteria bacterium]HPO63115.1 hybrid sensor histidine kinase/response regulator [Candidatus Kapabacteria bacterium]
MVNKKDNIGEDTTMLELFRIETENYSRILEAGLVELESDSSADRIEPLMRAAHSIKGAARIVGLNTAVVIAHSMEDMLSAAKKGDFTLDSSDIDILLTATDIFTNISKLQVSQFNEFLTENENKITDISNKIQTSLNSPKEKKVTVEKPVQAKEKPIIEIQNNIDISLLELFKSEVKTNCELIKKSTETLTQNYQNDEMKNLIRGIHSIRGASRIIGLNTSAELCGALENQLTDFSKLENIFNSNQINILQNVFDIYNALIEIDDNNFINRTNELYNDFIDLLTSVKEDFLKINDSTSNEKVETNEEKPIIVEEPKRVKVEEEVKEEIKEPTVKEQAQIILHTEAKQQKQQEAIVRVLAENLNKLLGFAGECLVQARNAKSFTPFLLNLKKRIMSLNSFKENIFQDLESYKISDEIIEKFSESTKELDAVLILIIQYIEQFENFSRRIESTAERLYNEAVATRMRPFSEGLHGFTRMVRDVSKQLEKKVKLEIIGENTRIDRDILEKLESPLNHLIRNAIDHGLETPEERITLGKDPTGTITIEAHHFSGMLIISVQDDGKGINLEKLRERIVEKGYTTFDMAKNMSKNELLEFLFLPGFSTAGKVTEISGRGVGLDIVFSMVHSVGGTIRADTEFGKGSSFQLQLPLTLSVIRALLLSIRNETYAIPLSRIDRILKVNTSELQTIEDKQYCIFEQENIGIIDSYQVFGYVQPKRESNHLNVIIISDLLNRYGMVIDTLIGEQDLVVVPLNPKLGRIPNISAGAILDDGSPVLIFDVEDLVRSIDNLLTAGRIEKLSQVDKVAHKKKRILVVDDSLTVREVERKLLENNGYEVTVAIDGIDGWNALHREYFDLMVSDIDMPRMNGIDLVKRVKSDSKLKSIPVMIVSYKDREEDKRLGLEAGANYYLTKSSFHDDALIGAVEDLIGKAE